ncbi:alpha-ketoglutarate-dependent dioxygenase AlkB family protein [Billgrantia endophytica]|uniref:Alpha-ketoglutarate-dependent dioxygenase AlkB n=1 Tax=Billgrantia endophytica TaxID=2033802 RepID=A0A2N7U3I4_9GAMM|nr:alpha-ketoglutarate-dependent dioxygenase AlkB [Halomonas endophytica]PMR75004.1 alpha-ketoglutarate-dependent dioxygenase AlkB [Halomonas endophytica]
MSISHQETCDILLASPRLQRFCTLLGEPEASDMLDRLDDELAWQQPRLRLYGQERPIPRQQVWMGDEAARYRYSGRTFTPEPWHAAVVRIRDTVIDRLAGNGVMASFNSVLLNRYEDGSDRMGWHSDDEPELGSDPLIAAVSLGAERPLRFRWKQGLGAPFNVWLPHDSLLLMDRGTQDHLQHALLPRRIPGKRISLTFRHVAASGGIAPTG